MTIEGDSSTRCGPTVWPSRNDACLPCRLDKPAAQAIGEIAILQDSGDLITRANPMDLGDVGLRLTPNATGGYDLSRTGFQFRSSLGAALTMADDDARDTALPFAFSYFGTSLQPRVRQFRRQSSRSARVDTATSERSVSRLLIGRHESRRSSPTSIHPPVARC
jgi:hypothetical protein